MLVLFGIAGFVEVAAYGQLAAFTPLYLPRLGVDPREVPFWVGAITSASNVVGLPFLPFWGALADRYGRKPLIIRSFVAAFVALALTALAPNLLVFTLARGFQALALGNTGLILATLSDHVPAGRIAFAYAVVNGANPFGAFVGPLAGGPVVDRAGFPTLIAADAVAMLAVVAMLVFGYTDRTAPRRGTSLLRSAGDGILLIVRSPRLRALFPALFLLFSGWMLCFIYVPLVVSRIYVGPNPATAVGIVLGAGGLLTLFVAPLIGAAADRVGHWRTLFIGGAAMIVLWIVPFFARDLAPFAVAWAVANAVVTAVFSVSFNVLASSASDAARSRVMTFAYLPTNMGFVVGPAIGSVVSSIDPFLVFPAAAVLTALGVAAVAYAYRQPSSAATAAA